MQLRKFIRLMILLCAPAFGVEHVLTMQPFIPLSYGYPEKTIGYEFITDVSGEVVVSGDCSFQSYGVWWNFQCLWDLQGHLRSVFYGYNRPAEPTPLYTAGTEIVYAVNGPSTTGEDTRGFGFVDSTI